MSSTSWKEETLCAEGKYGELDQVSIEELKDVLVAHEGEMLTIDVVILAIPCSRLIAEVFLSLGVPHVVCFDFADDFMNISIHSVENPMYEAMYTFC